MSTLPKLVCSFNTISIKIPAGFYFFQIEIYNLILKIHTECGGPTIAKATLKKNKIGGLKLRGFKTYTALVIKTVVGGVRQK